MESYLTLGAVMITAPVGICLANAVASRCCRFIGSDTVPPQFITLGAAAIGIVPVLWLSWSLALREISSAPLDILCGITYVLLTYGGFSFCYFHVLNASETSLHVHIMMRLLIEGGISGKELSRS